MKKFYAAFTKCEEFVVCIALAGIVVLMFLSAVLRKMGLPLNWAGDVSLLLFAWLCFLGADIAIKERSFVNVDMFLSKLPIKVQKWIKIACQIAAIVFLVAIAYNGIPLCLESVARKFSNMELSYVWATASVPVGAALMCISSVINLIKMVKSDDGNYSNVESEGDVC